MRCASRKALTVPLVVCATPIGNLGDVTLRVLDALRDADAVLCEDTRRTQILLDRYEIRARRLVSVHRHNEARRVVELLPLIAAGETHALVSDAGLPGVNDPGARLVEAAIAEGIAVTVLPGPSAVETALVASGLAAAQYRFLGYLPRREAELDALWDDARDVGPGRRRLRVAAAPAAVARAPRPVGSGAAGRRLPRADEAARGGRSGHGRRARGALRLGDGQGRGDHRRRPGDAGIAGPRRGGDGGRGARRRRGRAPRRGRRGRAPRARAPQRALPSFARRATATRLTSSGGRATVPPLALPAQ